MSEERYGWNHGEIGWTELMTTDTEDAARFYTETFGWTAEKMPMPTGDYIILKAGEEKVGGIMARPEEAGDAPPHWCSYVTVDDVDATMKKVEELGGKICHPPIDIPQVGRFIHFVDPQGAALAAITYAEDCGQSCDEGDKASE